MSDVAVCWICAKPLQRFGIKQAAGCPIHGSRGANQALAPVPSVPAVRLRDPAYDFTDSQE